MEKRVFLEDAEVGMVLARHVVTPDGSILLDPGTVLTKNHLERLARWNILSIYIEAPSVDPPEPEALGDESEPFAWGSLPPEEPIDWETLAEDKSLSVDEETLEAELEEKAARPSPAQRLPPPPEPFLYKADDLRRAKEVVERVHMEAARSMPHAIQGVRRRDESAIKTIRKVILRLVDQGLTNRHVLAGVAAIREYDDYLLTHTIKTTMYSLLLGYAIGMPREELTALGECALLHDIGMSKVAPAIWKKNGRLTKDERWEVMKHTIYGADILRGTPGVAPMADVVAYQHHERWDGSGYPKGKMRRTVAEYARIVGLADAFAAMNSPRPWRRRIPGYEAMRTIVANGGRHFDPALVQVFLQTLSLFPIGSGVRLTDGRRALVIGAVPHTPYRPVVRVIETGEVVDLSGEKGLGIVSHEALPPEEVAGAIEF